MIKEIDLENLENFLEKAKKLVVDAMNRMNQLGVDRLGPIYIKTYHNQTHGDQQRLHIDEDEYESDLVYCRKIDNDHSTSYEFGDFDLPYVHPDLDTVLRFTASIEEINDAIDEIESRIESFSESNLSIKGI